MKFTHGRCRFSRNSCMLDNFVNNSHTQFHENISGLVPYTRSQTERRTWSTRGVLFYFVSNPQNSSQCVGMTIHRILCSVCYQLLIYL
jgi:hypothetical protein